MSRPFAIPSEPPELAARLNDILVELGEVPLELGLAGEFGTYAALLMRWNARMNLTAVRDEEGILRRHFVESIVCARSLPIGIATLLDYGSGAGFPGVPIALCRREIGVTLGESQGKKAAFLQEAARSLALNVKIHGGRAELLSERFNCVTMRAVDRMGAAVKMASGLVVDGGYLALLTSVSEEVAVRGSTGEGFEWQASRAFPGSSERVLLLGQRHIVPRGTM